MSQVLIVDDEATIRNQFRDFLANWNVEVLVAGSLPEAEHLIAGHDVGVIIQDLFLDAPVTQVYEFIEKHCGPDLGREAIVITGYLAKADFRRMVDIGAYCFFEKPVSLDELLIATWAAEGRADRMALVNGRRGRATLSGS
ncbi:response regulator [Accumulibacter sp.]|uniref:response regulator n=1 Tax=Accumulibacter sp. TaxID=2053492 RepID=UPI001AD1EEF7|nr:response regulator [Accumulibacter sp.]MBN8454859.1 response regulator [Accumulibacter sp.]MBO3708002.1 response regulator [Candidatus Accumulibacter conexus]